MIGKPPNNEHASGSDLFVIMRGQKIYEIVEIYMMILRLLFVGHIFQYLKKEKRPFKANLFTSICALGILKC